MIVFNNAEIMTAESLVSEFERKCKNPTVERLMFIETKGNPMKPDKPSKMFPCYVAAYTEEPERMFKVYLVQYVQGVFQTVEVVIPAKDLGVTKRIWDRPPVKMQRDATPWIDSEVPQ